MQADHLKKRNIVLAVARLQADGKVTPGHGDRQLVHAHSVLRLCECRRNAAATPQYCCLFTLSSYPSRHPLMQLCGYVLCTSTGVNIHVAKVAVREDCRRQGMARRMMEVSAVLPYRQGWVANVRCSRESTHICVAPVWRWRQATAPNASPWARKTGHYRGCILAA